MALNPYALCPCGSGKKIKFCCGDLAGDMEKVLRMVEGDQPAAAVRHLEQLLKKHPGRISLLDLKSAVEMEIGWYDQAQVTVDEYVAVDPQNPNAWARRAALLAIHGDLHAAVDALQRSICYSEDPPYSSVILMAVRLLGQAFAENGDVLAAIAHFQLYSDVSPTRDLEGERELIRLTRELPIPELLKGPFRLRTDALGAELQDDLARARHAAARGAWRQAIEQLHSLQAKADDDTAIVYDVALLQAYMAQYAPAAAGLREFASRSVPHDEAVEALALAQMLDFDEGADRIKGVALTFEVNDTQPLAERLRRSDRTAMVDRPYPFWTSTDEGPPPESAYFVLDRPSPAHWEGISLPDVPRVIASIELFGRETDRGARAVVHVTKDDDFEPKLQAARELLEIGDARAAAEADQTSFSGMGNLTAYYSYLAHEVPVQLRMELFEAARRKAVFEVWPAAPQAALGGKSPRELAEDPQRKLDLEAAVLRLLETQVPLRMRQQIEPIFEQLGVQPLPQVEKPQEIPPERMTFARVRRMDAGQLTDEQIAKLALQAAIVDASRATAHLAPEILRRPQLHSTVNLYTVCHTAAMEAPDFAAASALLADARRLVSTDLIPEGIWDVLEFEAALDFLEEQQIEGLFARAAEAANANEDVARVFVRVLSDRGLITPDGRLRMPMPAQGSQQAGMAVPPSAQEPPKIWTPESEAAQQGKGKIWTPS